VSAHEDKLYQQREKKRLELQSKGIVPYQNNFKPTHTIRDVVLSFQGSALDESSQTNSIRVAGRLMAINRMGKAAFCRIQDFTMGELLPSDGMVDKLQLYLQRDGLEGVGWEIFQSCDLGDFIGVEGSPMRTKTGELTIKVRELFFLTKTLRPLPEKWHGLQDVETRYRQRYLDLISHAKVRHIFHARAAILQFIRQFLLNRDFIEVETPLLHALYGGAAARPFKTHHHTLDMELYLRIAPELYLKRLVVGGFERVFEIGRNFRNEGISTIHNPEFSMLEFYVAYHRCTDLMTWAEDLLTGLIDHLKLSVERVVWGEHEINFTPPFRRLRMMEAIERFGGPTEQCLMEDPTVAKTCVQEVKQYKPNMTWGQQIAALFEYFAEPQLIQPTFITHFPIDISPLARAFDEHPDIADRFELYVGGCELANSFSELNDPIEQRQRFAAQLNSRADQEEAHQMDEDYILALEHGMPPTAGFGMGLDRLTMLLSNTTSIREVILFPLLRPRG
jgi:lysyl-tRNA synthetase class 2